jgi:hypothetical protein
MNIIGPYFPDLTDLRVPIACSRSSGKGDSASKRSRWNKERDGGLRKDSQRHMHIDFVCGA